MKSCTLDCILPHRLSRQMHPLLEPDYRKRKGENVRIKLSVLEHMLDSFSH